MSDKESNLTEYDVAEKKKCIVCGDEFIPPEGSPNDRVCSENCFMELRYCPTCKKRQPVYPRLLNLGRNGEGEHWSICCDICDELIHIPQKHSRYQR